MFIIIIVYLIGGVWFKAQLLIALTDNAQSVHSRDFTQGMMCFQTFFCAVKFDALKPEQIDNTR